MDRTITDKLMMLGENMVNSIAAGEGVIGTWELSGSLVTGVVPALPARDLDLIVYINSHVEIDIALAEAVASAVNGQIMAFNQIKRFGIEMPLAHVTSTMETDRTVFDGWDIWITRDSFIPMSRYWQRLFSPQEIEWQGDLRLLVSRYLPAAEYQELKARQICEARWRFCLRLALPNADLPVGDNLLADDFLLEGLSLKAVPEIVKKWAEQNISDDWVTRPLVQLRLESMLELMQLGCPVPAVPAEPAWIQLAMRFLSKPDYRVKTPELSDWV